MWIKRDCCQWMSLCSVIDAVDLDLWPLPREAKMCWLQKLTHVPLAIAILLVLVTVGHTNRQTERQNHRQRQTPTNVLLQWLSYRPKRFTLCQPRLTKKLLLPLDTNISAIYWGLNCTHLVNLKTTYNSTFWSQSSQCIRSNRLFATCRKSSNGRLCLVFSNSW